MAANPDTNWLAKIEGKSFVNVSIDSANGDAINTEEFLQAARSLVTLFGMFNQYYLKLVLILILSCSRHPRSHYFQPRHCRLEHQHRGSSLLPLIPS